MEKVEVRPNRLLALFKKLKRKKSDGNATVDMTSIRGTIAHHLYIKVSDDVKPDSDQLEFFMDHINVIGEKTISVLDMAIQGPFDKPKKSKIKEPKQKSRLPELLSKLIGMKPKILAGISLAGLGIYGLLKINKLPSLTSMLPESFTSVLDTIKSIPSVVSNIIKNNEEGDSGEYQYKEAGLSYNKEEPTYNINEEGEAIDEEGNMIDPETGEILAIETVDDQGQINLNKKVKETLEGIGNRIDGMSNNLEKIVQFFSRGGFTSLADMLFDSNRNKDLVNFFKDNLRKYSEALYDVFMEFVGGIHKWVREKVLDFTKPVVDRMKSIKNAVTDRVAKIFMRERSAEKLHKNDKQDGINKSPGLFGQLAATLGNWFGGTTDTRNWKTRKKVDDTKPQDDEEVDTVSTVKAVDEQNYIADAQGDGSYSSLAGNVNLDSIKQAKVYQLPNGRWASDHPVMNAMIAVESMGDAKAQRTDSQFIGLLQFGNSARQQVGLSRADSYDAVKNFEAGKRLIMNNAKQLQRKGIPLTVANIYLAHQQGVGGLSNIYKHVRNGTSPAQGTELRTNLDSNHGKGKTPAQFLKFWQSYIEERHQSFINNFNAGIHLKGSLHEGYKPAEQVQSMTDESGNVDSSGPRESNYSANAENSTANITSSSRPYKAAKHARQHAHSKSLGKCARYVRQALQAAQYSITPNPSAYQYHTRDTLIKAGFSQIANNSTIQIGDVVVINSIPARNKPHGHIAIWDGRNWVSDFVQNNMSPYSFKLNGIALYRDHDYINGASIVPKQWQGMAGNDYSPHAVDPTEYADSDGGDAERRMATGNKKLSPVEKAKQMAMQMAATQNAGLAMMLNMAGLDLMELGQGLQSGEAPSAWASLINRDIDEDFANE